MKRFFALFSVLFFLFQACDKDTPESLPPTITIKTGTDLTADGIKVPTGTQLRFGLIAGRGGARAITNIVATRYTPAGKTVMYDEGIFVDSESYETVLTFTKSSQGNELWRFFVMNSNRDTASVTMTILQGEGSAWGEINHYSSIFIGYQGNTGYPNFIDLSGGKGYNSSTVAGHESDIDLAVIWYITSGKSSPTLSAPSYSSLTGYYPGVASWPGRNSTVFDYKTSDDKLISVEQFDAADNDSLLVAGFKEGYISGWCKYTFSDKVIPFKTVEGKYGLIKVISAGETADSFMEIEVKVQK